MLYINLENVVKKLFFFVVFNVKMLCEERCLVDGVCCCVMTVRLLAWAVRPGLQVCETKNVNACSLSVHAARRSVSAFGLRPFGHLG